jgi:hypothetical protein
VNIRKTGLFSIVPNFVGEILFFTNILLLRERDFLILLKNLKNRDVGKEKARVFRVVKIPW